MSEVTERPVHASRKGVPSAVVVTVRRCCPDYAAGLEESSTGEVRRLQKFCRHNCWVFAAPRKLKRVGLTRLKWTQKTCLLYWDIIINTSHPYQQQCNFMNAIKYKTSSHKFWIRLKIVLEVCIWVYGSLDVYQCRLNSFVKSAGNAEHRTGTAQWFESIWNVFIARPLSAIRRTLTKCVRSRLVYGECAVARNCRRDKSLLPLLLR